MKILCIDTATEACSAALLLDEKRDAIFEICPQQQSQRILPMIDELLTRNQVTLDHLDAIAYGRGPGSFTGVRIASSTVQGLALGSDLPVLEISTLAAMAQENFERFGVGKTISLIDARMSEVYFAEYQIDEHGIATVLGAEQVIDPVRVRENVLNSDGEHAYAGTGFTAYAEQLGIALQSDRINVNYPNAEFMLSLALWQYKNKQTVPVEEIQPVYLRDKVTWKKLPNRD